MARVTDDAVLTGARRALSRYGWDAVTLERIAHEAGVSRVTLHRRGVTKEVILARLADEAAREYREAMWPALTSAEPARARLDLALRTLCELAERNLELLLALGAQANAAVFHDEGEEILTRGVFTAPLERLLRDGMREGEVDVDDPIESATVLFNLVGWTYLHLRSEHRWAPERSLRAVVGTALHGVLTERRAEATAAQMLSFAPYPGPGDSDGGDAM